MPERGYISSGSSRGSTPSPRSSKSYLEPLSIQKGTRLPSLLTQPTSQTTSLTPLSEPTTKQSNSHYPPTYPSPPHTTLITPHTESTHAHSSSGRSSSKSTSSSHSRTTTSSRKSRSQLKPLSIHQHQHEHEHHRDSYTYTPSRDDIRSDKRQDSRYYPNSFLESNPKTHSSALRKEMDGRYYPNSSF